MRINLKREVDDSYDIEFGSNLFPKIAEDLREHPLGTKYAIITDSNVGPLYAGALQKALAEQGLKSEVFTFEAGEGSKNSDVCMRIVGEMSKAKFGRDTAILALGGGVTGDMAGFIAAMFNRGIPYVQIPTTVLAQADSSIGGKTAVDTEYGKNLVGFFKQPAKVYIDVDTLKTLSDKDYRSGLAETIKHAVIFDREFFEYLEQNIEEIRSRTAESALAIANANCRIKGYHVERDPNEKGLRRCLNYGHTAGHAIEKLSNYELSHGEAVSIGMMIAARIAEVLGYLSAEDVKRQEALLEAYDLPVHVPAGISVDDVIEVTTVDKKAKEGKARYALPVGIGKMHEFGGEYATYVDNDIVREAYESTIA
jgi:3-dehydroquinate synthase